MSDLLQIMCFNSLKNLSQLHRNPRCKSFALPILSFKHARFCIILISNLLQESLDNYLLGPLGGLQSLLQESLDKSLLGRVVTISAGPSRPYIISKQMEQLVYKNFQVIKEFEEHFFDFRKQDWNRSFIIETLLGHFDDVFKEVSYICFLKLF